MDGFEAVYFIIFCAMCEKEERAKRKEAPIIECLLRYVVMNK